MSIDETTLTQYALGLLEQGEYKMVHQEIIASTTLQQELVVIQNSLQQIAVTEKPLQPSHHLRNRILDSIHADTRYHGYIERFTILFDLDKLTSKKLLAKIEQRSDTTWKSTPFPGVNIMEFVGGPLVSESTCGIVEVESGKLFPAHEHQGDERMLVLQGTAVDDQQQTFSVGDIVQYCAGSRHSFRSIGDQSFLFAVVLQKKNKWLWVKTIMDQFRIKK